MTDAVWDGWWVVRCGQRLVHIEADDAEDAVQGSVEALRHLGDWTENADELAAFPYVEYGKKHVKPMEFTRAVIDRKRRSSRRHREQRGGRR